MPKSLFFILAAILPLAFINSQSGKESFISTEKGKGKFTISVSQRSAPLLISSKDWPGVIRAFNDLQTDIGKVTNAVPVRHKDARYVNPRRHIHGSPSVKYRGIFLNDEAPDLTNWIRIEDFGHTLSAMRATALVDAAPATPGKDSPCLEYQMYLFSTGTLDITAVFSPTLNFMAGRGMQYAIAIDNQTPQIVTLVPGDYNARNRNTDWEKSVSDNARFSQSNHVINTPGYHTLKIFMVDPGVVLQKIIVNSGGLKPSYPGPPESFFNRAQGIK